MPKILGALKPLTASSPPFSLWNVMKKEENQGRGKQDENDF
jgi:hypothetical protein